MIRLAVLLVGARALRSKWPVLAIIGQCWIILGFLIIADAADGVTTVATHTFGYLLVVEGAAALFAMLAARSNSSGFFLMKAAALIVLGFMIVALPPRGHIAHAVLFGLAFIIDGVTRAVTAYVVRHPRWRTVIAGAVLEAMFGAMLIAQWPYPYRKAVPFVIAIALILSGWTVFNIALRLRRIDPNRSVTTLPIFGRRQWSVAHPVSELPPPEPVERRTGGHHHHHHYKSPHPKPLVVHVWTPLGSADHPMHRPVVDRYIAAVDSQGVISTGHAALELPPDLYISHYPAEEIDHSPSEFTSILRAGHENDVKGRFQPSYAIESANWCPADVHIKFRRYNAENLRAFWQVYSRDDTYNLTNRNCSVTVITALEAALEGTVGARRWVWPNFLLLLVNPDMWLAAVLRGQAEAMTWTPGLAQDYARALRRVVEPLQLHWFDRVSDSVRRYREARHNHREAVRASRRAFAGLPSAEDTA